jgi:RNA polymerase sigma-70 factor (ECF subfamily)
MTRDTPAKAHTTFTARRTGVSAAAKDGLLKRLWRERRVPAYADSPGLRRFLIVSGEGVGMKTGDRRSAAGSDAGSDATGEYAFARLNLLAATRVLRGSELIAQRESTLPLADKRILDSAILMTRCQRGDAEAFAGIVQLWERPLFYYLRRLAPSEADTWDLLQETWLRVYRSMRSLRDPQALPAFLYATARNVAVTRLRLRTMDEQPSAQNGEGAAALDCAFIAFDDAEQVHHALDQLPLAQREALTLYFLEDLSIDDIAQVLNVPAGTVKSRLHYGKQAIRKFLENGDGHDK